MGFIATLQRIIRASPSKQTNEEVNARLEALEAKWFMPQNFTGATANNYDCLRDDSHARQSSEAADFQLSSDNSLMASESLYNVKPITGFIVNPATGLPMIEGGLVDVGGDVLGSSFHYDSNHSVGMSNASESFGSFDTPGSSGSFGNDW